MTRRRAKFVACSKYEGERHEPTRELMKGLIVTDNTPEQIADTLFSTGALKRCSVSSNSDGGAGAAGSPARR